jgi:membrane associated rhomboid family serine protease
MGIYDREYYRREGPSFLGSIVERGLVCKWLIGINVACFIIQMMTRTPMRIVDPETGLAFAIPGRFNEPFTNALALSAAKVLHGEVWRLLTYAFLHSTGNIWHIVFNMVTLWFFGRQIEDERGPREFLAFYLLSAVVSGVVYVAAVLVGLHHAGGIAVGASGAVIAVLVLCACYHPKQIIYLFFVIPVPIWAVAIFLVVLDSFSLLGQARDNIATSAHLGGAAFAAAYYLGGLRLTGWWEGVKTWHRRRAQPRLRIYREEPPTPVGVTAAGPPDLEALRAEMDAILEKISRVGQDQLTEQERQVLQKASEVFKRRRG